MLFVQTMLDPIHVPVMQDLLEMGKPAMVCSSLFKYKPSLCNVNVFFFNKLSMYLMNMVHLNQFLSLRNYRIPKSVMSLHIPRNCEKC